MTDYDDNEYAEYEESPPPGGRRRGGNRTFMLAISVLGAIFLISLIALILYALVLLPARSAARQEQAAQINAQNTATSYAATEIAFAEQLQLTPSETPLPTVTLQPSSTPVVVFGAETPSPEIGLGEPAMAADLSARTATVAALLTQAAQGQGTVAATSHAAATALPSSGFADEVGLPGLAGLAAILLVLIFFARRLRLSSN